MRKTFIAAGALAFILGTASTALALDCGNSFKLAGTAIEKAEAAMKAMKDEKNKVLANALIEDAKMLLAAGRITHNMPKAVLYDHARAVAMSRSAAAAAEAAVLMAKKRAK